MRRTAPRAAVVARSPRERVLRRFLAGYLVALVAAPPLTLAAHLLVDRDQVEAPTARVVRPRCVDGRITEAVDTGRPDGLLLARDTGQVC